MRRVCYFVQKKESILMFDTGCFFMATHIGNRHTKPSLTGPFSMVTPESV